MNLESREIGPLTVLFGNEQGKYPHGNSLLVKGRDKTVIIDPSLGLVARGAHIPEADMILLSHVHEDHVAGVHLYPDAPCFAHVEDADGIRSLEGFLAIYGFEGQLKEEFAKSLTTDFFFEPRTDVQCFVDDAIFDLGGVSIRVIHTPGHTRGHSCFLITWDDSNEAFVYLGDIDLSGFGPYYGDAWSNLIDFETSLTKLRDVEANYWLTFHHKGLIEGRAEFLALLQKFHAVIPSRENKLLAFLAERRTMAEIVEHRFVYRPGIFGPMYDAVETRSMGQHLDRLLEQGEITQQQVSEQNTFQKVIA